MFRIPGIPNVVRYDNYPLYFVSEHGKKQGRIGLIDVESSSISTDAKGLTNLVRMFPYHLNMIIEEADRMLLLNRGDNNLKKVMNYNINDLKNAAEMGEKYLSAGYWDHSDFLKEKEVSTDSK